MSKNAMAGAVTLCGVGLCMIGGAMLMQSGAQAHANSVVGALPAAAAVASTATAQAGGEPTIVWFGVTQWSGSRDFYRLWSDGRLEYRTYNGVSSGWTEVPAPPGGNGFACRADINGDRVIDGADLTFVLSSWGQQGSCEPEATYPCLDLGNLVGNVAVK
jgi:hypothetical protein